MCPPNCKFCYKEATYLPAKCLDYGCKDGFVFCQEKDSCIATTDTCEEEKTTCKGEMSKKF